MDGVLENGVNYSWGDCTLIIFGFTVVGWRGIDIKRKQEKTNNYGAGNEPVSRGRGRIEYECTIKGVYLDELRPIRAASPNQDILKINPSSVKILVTSANGVPQIITLKNMEFLEDPFSVSEGDTKIIMDIPLIISGVKFS